MGWKEQGSGRGLVPGVSVGDGCLLGRASASLRGWLCPELPRAAWIWCAAWLHVRRALSSTICFSLSNKMCQQVVCLTCCFPSLHVLS